MQINDFILLLHPVLAVALVYPLLGMVVHRAIKTRQRRLNPEKFSGGPIGPEHMQLDRWLTTFVVGLVLLALAHDVLGHVWQKRAWVEAPLKTLIIGVTFLLVPLGLVLLHRIQAGLWRVFWALVTCSGLFFLGSQDGVYRNSNHWYASHYYYGMVVMTLVIFSAAIVREIYRDKSNRVRTLHVTFNCLALLFFVAQAITGTLSLLEMPLSWQKQYVQQLYSQDCENRRCAVIAPQN
jgi:Protein of unknown function (DUF4079)